MREIVAYARVSTMHQAESGLGIKAQRARIEAQAFADGVRIDQMYVDDGISGKTLQRPAFVALLAEVEAKRVQTVYTYSFSRVSRSAKDMLNLVDLLRRHHVRLVSIVERVDTDSSTGRFMMTVFAALAELEREQAAERTKAALEAKKAAGLALGKAPYGHTIGAQGRLEVEPDEQATIARARDLRRQGASTRGVAAALNFEDYRRRSGKMWTHDTVIRQLLRKKADETDSQREPAWGPRWKPGTDLQGVV